MAFTHPTPVFDTKTIPTYFQVTGAISFMADWEPLPTSPYRDTSYGVWGLNAQVHYWPVTAPQPAAVTAIVDSDGSTS